MYDDIIVPTDGGEQMDAVIDAAVDIAIQRSARIHALSVIDRGVFLTLEEGLTDAVDEELTANAERAVKAVTTPRPRRTSKTRASSGGAAPARRSSPTLTRSTPNSS
jgi:Universal stress protein family.